MQLVAVEVVWFNERRLIQQILGTGKVTCRPPRKREDHSDAQTKIWHFLCSCQVLINPNGRGMYCITWLKDLAYFMSRISFPSLFWCMDYFRRCIPLGFGKFHAIFIQYKTEFCKFFLLFKTEINIWFKKYKNLWGELEMYKRINRGTSKSQSAGIWCTCLVCP